MSDKPKAAPSQEPVAWMHVQGNYEEAMRRQLDDDEIKRGWTQYPLYRMPPDAAAQIAALKLTAAARMALEQLEKVGRDQYDITEPAITTLREALGEAK